MWDWYDSSYDGAEDLEGLTHHHSFMQPSYDYGIDGIGMHSSGRGIFGVGQHYNHVCFPVSYVMIDNDGQEQEPHHSMYPQIMTNHISHPLIPELQSVQSLMQSPGLSHSYLMYQPSMAQQIQQLPSPSPPPSLAPLTPPPIPSLPLTNGSSMTEQQHEQCTNSCNNSGATNIDDTRAAVGERVKRDSLPFLRQLLSDDLTVSAGMTSSVIIRDSILSRQQQSNNDEIAESNQSLTATQEKPTNEIKKHDTMAVDDDKVVTVCKQTILSAINKIIAVNYESALHKLRKIIRVLDILMFNEGGSGIGSAKIETVRPWLETLKDMEERVSLKHRQQHKKNSNHNPDNSVLMKAERSYYRQVRQRNRYYSSRNSKSDNTIYHYYKNACSNISSNGPSGRNKHQIWWKSNNKRYRTTGKLIMEQC